MMTETTFKWLQWVSELQGLAQAGLTYTQSEFDKERYTRLRDLAAELAAHCSEHSVNEAKDIFLLEKGYETPKIDVRSYILKDKKILLVKERSDGLWTLLVAGRMLTNPLRGCCPGSTGRDRV